MIITAFALAAVATVASVESDRPILRGDDPAFGHLDLSISAGFVSTTFAPVRRLTVDDAPIPFGPLHIEGRYSELTGQVRLTGNIDVDVVAHIGARIADDWWIFGDGSVDLSSQNGGALVVGVARRTTHLPI